VRGAYGQVGGYDQGNASKGAFMGNIGSDFNVGPGIFSADVVGGYRKDAVSLGSQLVGTVDANGYPTNVNSGFVTSGANAGNYSQFMQATISNNTTVMATAKYSVDRLKLYAGYEWIQFANPSDPVSSFTDIAGDFLCAGCQIKPGNKGAGLLFNGTNINNTAYNVDQIRQLAWFGGRYALTDSLDVAAAYYHIWQNDYSNGATSAAGGTCAVSTTSQASCAGSIDAVSALIDWKFAPKWDTYLATLYSRNNGGLDRGYLARDNWATTAGLRFRW
jgi:predicted porin